MKLIANLTFDRQALEALITAQASSSGYMLCGHIEWGEDSAAYAQVRPMTLEEKEEAGLDTRDPMDVALEYILEHIQRLFERQNDALREATAQMLAHKSAAPGATHAAGVPVLDASDYSGSATLVSKEQLEGDALKARRSVEKIRAEQDKYPSPYHEGMVDEDGCVKL